MALARPNPMRKNDERCHFARNSRHANAWQLCNLGILVVFATSMGGIVNQMHFRGVCDKSRQLLDFRHFCESWMLTVHPMNICSL